MRSKKKANKAKVNEAGGRLLAAEAEFLRAWGWWPVVPSPNVDVVWSGSKLAPVRTASQQVYWTKNGTTLRQATAVQLQKLEHGGMT